MNMRRWLIPALLAGLFSVIALWPVSDRGREWLLQLGVAELDALGYSLDYTRSAGNPWLGVELFEVTITGPGVELRTDTLVLDYFLPSLLTAELPVSLALGGLRGELDLESLALPAAGPGSGPVAVFLRELSVEDVEVEVGGIPWSLPPLDVHDVSARHDQDGFRFEATLRSSEGQARIAGLARFEPWSLELEVQSTDARLARHWWAGAAAGTVQGRVSADPNGVLAELAVSGGEVSFLGTSFSDVSGPVSFDRGVISGRLAGVGLGGPLVADVQVNVPARRWEADVVGRPGLPALAQWLGRGGFDPESLGLTGAGDVSLTASGWRTVTVAGQGRGSGTLLGRSLADLAADFTYEHGAGATVDGSGLFGGGPLAVSVRPEAGASRINVTVEDARLLQGIPSGPGEIDDGVEGPLASLDLTATTGPAGLRGGATAGLTGELAGRSIEVGADMRLDEDGLQVFVDGVDGRGGTAEGAIVLAGGRLEGQLSIRDLSLPGLAEPVEVTVRGDGPLASLPLELELAGPGAARPELLGLRFDRSVAGRVAGTLRQGEVGGIDGTLGPLSLAGNLDLAPLRLDLEYRLAGVAADGPVDLDLSGAAGALSLAAGETAVSGRLALARLVPGDAASAALVGDLVLGPVDMVAEGRWNREAGGISFASVAAGDETLSATDPRAGDGRIAGRLDDDGFTLALAEPPLTLAGDRLLLAGSVSDPAQGPAVADLRLAAERMEARVRPAATGHDIRLSASPGLRLGPFALSKPLEAAGTVDEGLSLAQFRGTLAGLPWSATLERGAGGVAANLLLSDGLHEFEISLADSGAALSAGGLLELDPLATALGLPVSGLLQGDLSRTAEGFAGSLAADVDAAGVPLRLTLSGLGERLGLSGETDVAGAAWTLRGDLGREPTLEARSRYGSLRLAGGRIDGGGVLPERIGPLELAPLEWRAQGELAASTLSLSVGESTASVDWSEGLAVRASLDQGARLYGVATSLVADVGFGPTGDGSLDGVLRLAGQPLAITGTAREVRLAGVLDAPALSAALVGAPALAGRLTVEARAPLPTLAGAEVSLALTSGESTVEARLRRQADGWTAEAGGSGLQASYSDGLLRLGAEQAKLDPFIAPGLLADLPKMVGSPGASEAPGGAVVDGTLERGRQGWQGELAMRLARPELAATLTGEGERLLLAAQSGGARYRVRADGSLLPRLDIAVNAALNASALEGQLALAGAIRGTPARPVFGGTMTSGAADLGPVSLPPLTLAVDADSAGVSVAGDGVSLKLGGTGLSGMLDLDLEVAGRPHDLVAALSGSLTRPRVDMDLAGAVAAGSARWEGDSGTAALALTPSPWLPAGFEARSPARLAVTLESSGLWQASLLSELALAGTAVDLTGRLSGEGASYRGEADLATSGGRLLAASLEGRGLAWGATVDLSDSQPEALAELLPVESRLRLSGSVRLESARRDQAQAGPGPVTISADAGVAGIVLGRELSLAVTGGAGEPFRASGSVAGSTLEAESREGEARFDLRAERPGTAEQDAEQVPIELAGVLGWRDGLRLSLQGAAAGRAVAASGNVDSSGRSGQLTLSVGESRLELTATPLGDGDRGRSRVSARVDNKSREPLGIPFEADLRLLAGAGGVALEGLTAAAPSAAGDARLVLAGPLWPEAGITGTLAAPWPGGEESLTANVTANVTVAGTLARPELRLSGNGLALSASRGTNGWRAALAGSAVPPGDTPGRLSADLAWTESGGFAGTAEVELEPGGGDYLLRAGLAGSGPLDLTLRLERGGQTMATGDARLAARPWSDQSLTGELALAAGLGDLWQGYRGESLALTGNVELAGTLREPKARGTLALAGAIEAVGEVDYSDGRATVELKGAELSLHASGRPGEGIDGELALTGLRLDPLFPALPGGAADAQADFRLEPGGAAGTVRRFAASWGASSLVGSASFREVWGGSSAADSNGGESSAASSNGGESSAASSNGGESSAASAVATLDLDLADLPVGTPLAGTLTGSLALAAHGLGALPSGTLRGDLRLESAGPAAGDSALSGAVSLAGPVNDPRLRLDLAGQGSAAGELTVDAAPASGRLMLESTLSWGPVASDLILAAAANELAVGGRIDLPGGYFTLANGGRRPGAEGLPPILLHGFDDYRGWLVQLTPTGPSLSVRADLETLGRGLSGNLDVRAGPPAGEAPWLLARFEGLGWRGVRLGEVRVESAAPAAEVTIAGPNIRASVRPAHGFAWDLQELRLPLPAGFAATASGGGRGGEGRLEAVASGALDGKQVTLPLTLRRGSDARLEVAGEGSLLDGSVALQAAFDPDGEESGWSGTLRAEALELAGGQAELLGTLSGPLAVPRFDLTVAATAGGFSLSGGASLSPVRQSAALTLASPRLSEPLTITAKGGEEPAVRVEGAGEEALGLTYREGLGEPPSTSGKLAFDVGPARLALTGGSGLALSVSVPDLPGFALAGELDRDVLANSALVLERPIRFVGGERTTGTVDVSFSPLTATLGELSYRTDEVDVRLSGTVGPGVRADLSGRAELLAPVRGGVLPSLPPGRVLPFRIVGEQGAVTVESVGEVGSLRLSYDVAAGTAQLSAALAFAEGSAEGDIRYDPETGPSGRFSVASLPVYALADRPPLRLTGDFDVTPREIAGGGLLRMEQGSLRASTTIGLGLLLPEALAPLGERTRRLDLQLGTFDLAGLPLVADRLPHLSAPLSGFLQIHGNNVVGRVVAPAMAVAGEPLPLSIDISGTTDRLLLDTLLAGSRVRLNSDTQGLNALATLDMFPLHLLAEAATGPTDVTAEATGVARLVLPWDERSTPTIEVATELVRLERAGVVTTGNVSLVLANGELSVREAEFNGAGRWRAEGSVRPDLLDFSLSAQEADFGPLLGLVPNLARFGVGAQGSLELQAAGTLAEPRVTLASPALRFEVAGSSYTLEEGLATLEDDRLTLAARVEGVSPMTGQLVVAGEGTLGLLPFRLSGARFTARGAANVPGLGEISEFEAIVTSRPEVGLWLEGGGRLGQPFTVAGRLAPLDIALEGDDLSVRLPQILLASAELDAGLRLTWEDTLRFSGTLDVDQARFELGIRPQRDQSRQGPNPVAERVVFENVAIRAPGRVRFSENFGTAEMSLDLVLSGNAAQPALSGTADALRGNIQFSGRDFEIRSATARFDPSRGVLPVLDVDAVTSFDMSRVLPAGGNVRFVAPQEGSRFEVVLAFTGEVEPAPGLSPPIRLDLSPSLTSEALIQELRGDGITSGPRSLSEPELLSLLTLGRLDLNAPLAGQSGLATAVAEGAIDTAVSLLIVSEIQTAIAEALGLDVVEIRTTSLSSIISRGTSDPFSVSLRLGGYLSDEVFASYRIGTFDDELGLYALTNEVSLVYDLGPLELDLAGRVNFEDAAATNAAAELSATVRYAFNPATSLEAGADLSNAGQQVRFGVTVRW
jgi:hypothetical protein